MQRDTRKYMIHTFVLCCFSLAVTAQVTGEQPLLLPSHYITTDYNLDGTEDIVFTIDDTVFIAARIGYAATPLHQFILDAPDNVRAGDIDGDRFPELIFSNRSEVRYVKNNEGLPGEVVFLETIDRFYEWTTVFDYDQDGDGDLLQNVYDLTIYLIENENGTMLTADKQLLTYTNKEAIQTDESFCDINQDGYMDVLLYHPPGDMTLLWNYGNGRFAVTPEYFLGRSTGETHDDATTIQYDMDDVNGDGFPDLYGFTSFNGDTYLEIYGNQFGTINDYLRYIRLEDHPIAIDVIDVNQDLQPDVVIADTNSITVLTASQDTFDHVGIWTSPGTVQIDRINVTDLDEDGSLEIIVIYTDSTGHVLTTTWQTSGPEYTCNRLPDPLDCPPGDITFATQAELDQFSIDYPDCKILNGKLALQDAVNDIDPLANVISVKGSVEIAGSQFDSLYQSNLRFVHGNLHITGNPALEELYFDELRYVRDTLLIADNGNLLVIDSFNKVASASVMQVKSNPLLHTIRGFSHPTSTTRIELVNNGLLDTLIAFNPITSHPGDPYNLPDLLLEGNTPALCYIDGVLDTFIFKNAHTANLSLLKFNNFETLVLDNISGITSLDGLSRQDRYSLVADQCPDLISLGGYVEFNEIEIRNCPSLASLSGFKPSTSMGKIALINLPLLTSLQSLPLVNRINGGIHLEANPALTDISVLPVQLPNTLRTLAILDNPLLSMCNVDWVCDFLERDDDYRIDGNASGCHTGQAVNAACGFVPPISMELTDDPGEPTFFPNPAPLVINIVSDELPGSLRLYDVGGWLINEVRQSRSMNVDHVANGIYTLVIERASGVTARKVVVAH